MDQLHHGLIIEKAVRRSGLSISEIARILKVNRRSIYNYFTQQRLSIDVISSFETLLAHDFSEEIPEYSKYKLKQPAATDQQVMDWKARYLNLLEKYNELLLKMHKYDVADVA